MSKINKEQHKLYKLSIYSNLKGELNFVSELLCKMGINNIFENMDKLEDELYLENGEKASLEDVCKWWIKTYPADVFVNKPKPIVEVRMCLQNILIMCKKDELIRGTDEEEKRISTINQTRG